MTERPVTLEHLSFPGLSRERGLVLQRELEVMESAARLFAAGIFGLPVQISWSLGRSRPAAWLQDRAGRLSLHLWVDLESPLNLPEPPPGQGLVGPTEYKAAFRSGYLHALGRMLGAPPPGVDHPIDVALSPGHPGLARMRRSTRDWLLGAEGRLLVTSIWERLEAARCDYLLTQGYRGAARHLQLRSAFDRRASASDDSMESALGLSALILREGDTGSLLTEDVVAGIAPQTRRLLDVEAPYLKRCLRADRVAGGYLLAETVAHRLAPRLRALAAAREPDSSDAVHRLLSELGSIATRDMAGTEVDLAGPRAMIGTQIVFLPHRQGGEAMVRIDVAEARALPETALNRRVLDALVSRYGQAARDAMAEHSDGLRRALQVNWERRERGRYRSGKRIGIPHLRRFLTLNDLRLFQRLERPRSLSYYFHLLVDVSYSMFEEDNGAKALAAAYAFAETLTRLRLPVDVTLYSSGVTDLYDHRRDVLQPYFGADFGYLISGTMEMEAIAFAKAKADRLPHERKVFVVVTDGTPVKTTLPFVGDSDLAAYYNEVLVPWLKRSGIDLLAMGIGLLPAYHPKAVQIAGGWQALGVFAELLEEVISVGRARTEELWL